MELFFSFIESVTLFEYNSLLIVAGAGGIILLLILSVFLFRPQTDSVKVFLFFVISVVTIATTLYIVLGTINLIQLSSTGGPVHWHADFRVFMCGEELNLIDPSGFSNKVGTQVVHEHGDKRIHIEGIPKEETSASLTNFIRATGGMLSQSSLSISTSHGDILMQNGDMCADKEGVLQVFLWKTENGEAIQRKLESFPDYVISPETLVPPGDCIIFEFDEPKERTEYICEQYSVAEAREDLIIERSKP